MKLAYSVNEAMQAIGVGRTKLYAEINAGKIKTRKLGTKTIIAAKDLNEYIESLPAAGKAAA